MEGKTVRPHSHVAYTDEAQYNTGRYRGLGMVSARAELCGALRIEALKLLEASGVVESKWEKVRSARMRFVAEKVLDWATASALAGQLRVDVLTWDTEDSARSGTGLPHLTTLRLMYAYLLGTVLPARWPDASGWRVLPDEQGAMGWDRLAAALPYSAAITPCHSDAEPLIQVADLFVGMGLYSRSAYDTYERWLCFTPAERGTGDRLPGLALSASDRVRCHILDQFYTRCTLLGLGVSLRTYRGLRTYGMAAPLAFHWYSA
jgi:hypothetical protein